MADEIALQTTDYSRYADLLADAFSIAGFVGIADESATAAFVTAPIFVGTLGIRIAGRSGCKACPTAHNKTETGQRYCGKTEAKSCEGLPPRYRLRYTFGHLVEFVVHNCFLFLSLCSEPNISVPEDRMREPRKGSGN